MRRKNIIQNDTFYHCRFAVVIVVSVLSLSLETLRFCVRMKQLTNEVYMDPVRAYSIELVAKL